VSGFEPVLGKVAEAVGLMKEAQEIITGLGGKVQVASLVRGGVQGSLSIIVEYEDTAAYGAALDQINADEGMQQFMARAQASAVAVPVRTVDYVELPGLETSYDDIASCGVIMASLFQIREGRQQESYERIQRWKTLTEKQGAKCRALQAVVSDPAFLTATVSYYDNFTEWGKIGQALSADSEWQAFLAEINGENASADFLRTSLLRVI
jgi:hypothetical protein